MFLREGLDTRVAEQPVVGQIRKGQNLLSHPNPDISSLCRKEAGSCGYKCAAHLIFDGEHIQIEAFELRPVNVRL
jgi:hypothetical protein